MAFTIKSNSKQEPTSRVRKALVAIALCFGLVAAPAISGVFDAEPVGAQEVMERVDGRRAGELLTEIERLQGEIAVLQSIIAEQEWVVANQQATIADQGVRVDRLRANVRVQQERSLTNIRWRQRLQGVIADQNATIAAQNEQLFFQGQEISFLRNAIPAA